MVSVPKEERGTTSPSSPRGPASVGALVAKALFPGIWVPCFLGQLPYRPVSSTRAQSPGRPTVESGGSGADVLRAFGAQALQPRGIWEETRACDPVTLAGATTWFR